MIINWCSHYDIHCEHFEQVVFNVYMYFNYIGGCSNLNGKKSLCKRALSFAASYCHWYVHLLVPQPRICNIRTHAVFKDLPVIFFLQFFNSRLVFLQRLLPGSRCEILHPWGEKPGAKIETAWHWQQIEGPLPGGKYWIVSKKPNNITRVR